MNFTDPNLQWVLLASLLLGIASAVLGSFALLRGRSLMGDALAHAALPGVCLAFLAAEFARAKGWIALDAKNFWLLLIGAAITGMIAAWCVASITRYSRLKEDAAQAITLSVFFGGGIVLLTHIQHSGSGSQSGLDKFLFGQAASLVANDVRVMAVAALVLSLLAFILYKELKLLCFDPEFGGGAGFPMARLDGLLLVMIVAAVVIGLQAVGVVLISALLILPAASARFWTDKLHFMVPLSATLGGLSGVFGAILSATAPRMPTGPLIVLAATAIFIASLFLAPGRGVIARLWRVLSTRRRVQRENLLRDLYELSEDQAPDEVLSSDEAVKLPTFSIAKIGEKRTRNRGGWERGLAELARSHFAEELDGEWRLTATGLAQAYRVVRRHRLWEMFLMYETSLGEHSVDRDADAVEHFLPSEAVEQLEEMMRSHRIEPKLKPNLKPDLKLNAEAADAIV